MTATRSGALIDAVESDPAQVHGVLLSAECLASVPEGPGVTEASIIEALVSALSVGGQGPNSAAYAAFEAGKYHLAGALAEAYGIDDRSRNALMQCATGTMTPRAALAIGILLRSGVRPVHLESSVRRAANSPDAEVARICLRECGAYERFAPLLVHLAVEALDLEGEGATRVLGNLAVLPEEAADALRTIMYDPDGSGEDALTLSDFQRGDGGCRFLVSECNAGRLPAASLGEIVSKTWWLTAPGGREGILQVLREKGQIWWGVELARVWAMSGWFGQECDRCLLDALGGDPETLESALATLRLQEVADRCDGSVLERCWELAQDRESPLIAAMAIRALAGHSVPSTRVGRAIETMLPDAEGAVLMNLLEAARSYAEAGGTVRIPIESYLASDDWGADTSAIWAAAYVAPDGAITHLIRKIEAGVVLDAAETAVTATLAQEGEYRRRCARVLGEQARLAALVPRPDLVLSAASGLARSDPGGDAARRSVACLITLLEKPEYARAVPGYWEGALEVLSEMESPPAELVRRCESVLRSNAGSSRAAYNLMLRIRGM